MNTWLLQMFETQIYHFETRQAKKPKSSVDDLDIFVECEVHSADVGILITSLKRLAKDVRTSREDKGKKYLHLLVQFFWSNFFSFSFSFVIVIQFVWKASECALIILSLHGCFPLPLLQKERHFIIATGTAVRNVPAKRKMRRIEQQDKKLRRN